jgi:serine/threonine protein kinase
MEVYCTRPRTTDEAPHWTRISEALLSSSDPQRQALQNCKCAVCGMPLILGNDRYVPIEALGQGGFGYTFLAWDLKFPYPNGTYATRVIKQFRSDQLGLPGQIESALRSFKQEVQILSTLKHPQIPLVYEPFQVQTTANTYAYFVQEHVPGKDLQVGLRARKATDQSWTEAEIRDLLTQLLEILNYIHTRFAAPIVHRDIKPSNIIQGEDGRFHLVDFGSVKQVVATIESGLSHPETQCVVSAGYSPPEQYHGQVDCSSDLYALGKTCISLLTGSQAPQRDWQKSRSISPKLVRVLQRMTQSDPQARYRSTTAVQTALATHRWAIPSSQSLPTPIAGTMVKWLLIGSGMSVTATLLTAVLSNSITNSCPEKINDIVFPDGTFETCCSTSWEALSDAISSRIQQPNTKTRFLRQELPPSSGPPNSELGLDRLIEGKLDFALISKNIPEINYKTAKAKNLTLHKIPIGKISLAVVVHPSLKLPLNGITDEQLTQITNCTVRNWQELDGPDLPIRYYTTKPQIIVGCPTQKEIRHANAAHASVAQDLGGIAVSPSSFAKENCDIQVLSFGVNRDHLIHPFEGKGVSQDDCRSGKKSKVSLAAIKDPDYAPRVLELSIVLSSGSLNQSAGKAYVKAFQTEQGKQIMGYAGAVPCGEIWCSQPD